MENNIKKSQNRVRGYTILRVLAIFLVVIGHSVYIKMWTGLGKVMYEFNIEEHMVLKLHSDISGWIYQFHMPLFFMLSGAVYHLSEKKSLDILVKNKLKRLIIPFFVFGVLFMLPVKKLGNFYEGADFIAVIRSFFDNGESGHLWFLPSLFWVSIVFYLLLKVFKNKSNMALLFISYIIQKYYEEYIKIDVFYFAFAMKYVFWYALGYCFEGYRAKVDMKKKFRCIITILLFVMMIVDFNTYVLNINARIILCSLFFYNISFLIADTKFGNLKIIDFLERYSIYIYLFHDPLEYVVLRIAFNYNILQTTIGIASYILLRTVGVIVVSLIIAIIVEKLKQVILNYINSNILLKSE